MGKMCESKSDLFTVNEKPRKSSYRLLFIMIILFNLLSISFMTCYVVYNLWFSQQNSEQTFIELDNSDGSLLQIKYNSIKPYLLNLFSSSSSDYCSVPDEKRFDCNPEDPVNKEVCEARGCCWVPAGSKVKRGLPPLNVPYCFYPTNYNGYEVVGSEIKSNGATIKLKRRTPSSFRKDIENVKIEINGLDDERLRVRFVDADAERYEVTLPYFNLSSTSEITEPLYKVELTDNKYLKIIRKSTGTVIFNTDLSILVYSDQFIQMSSLVPSKALYGLGEHADKFRKEFSGWKRLTMFNRDIGPEPNVNLYGSYPIYMMVEDDAEKHAHGVFLLNSNAMDVIMQPTPALTWRPIGGILDFFIYMGPTVKDVYRQSINLIGRPTMQPWWSFGFHICRYGYNTLNTTRKTLERNLAAGIPIEAQWNDIDAMHNYNDFTIDPVNFAGLKEYVDWLHSKNMHYILILDPGVSGSEKPGTYSPFDDGVEMNIFVKNNTGDIFYGHVWNLAYTVYPDFTNPKTADYWTKQFISLHKQAAIDGAWIDMNEPSNFYNGQENGCPDLDIEKPQYTPGSTPLTTKTICMSAKHYLGSHYDTHNIYSTWQTVATHKAMVNITGKRPFILSRSSFPSMGHWGAHWSGDVSSTWDKMKYSISNMLEFNFYGVPMVGTDICGFNDNTNEELCMRWQALGAFYPFSRNHNDKSTIEQDPAALGPKVIAATKTTLNLRYQLIPYLYTLFFKAHMEASPVIRPLFYEFPEDDNTYAIEYQFMWGSGLMIVPILDQGRQTVATYFPKGRWIDYFTFQTVADGAAQTKEIAIDDDKIGVYVRSGSIIPNYKNGALTMSDLKKQSIWLGVFLDEEGKAEGDQFDDDGESIDNIAKGNYTYSECTASQVGVKCVDNVSTNNQRLGGIFIVGLKTKPSTVTVNGVKLSDESLSMDGSVFRVEMSTDFQWKKSLDVTFD